MKSSAPSLVTPCNHNSFYSLPYQYRQRRMIISIMDLEDDIETYKFSIDGTVCSEPENYIFGPARVPVLPNKQMSEIFGNCEEILHSYILLSNKLYEQRFDSLHSYAVPTFITDGMDGNAAHNSNSNNSNSNNSNSNSNNSNSNNSNDSNDSDNSNDNQDNHNDKQQTILHNIQEGDDGKQQRRLEELIKLINRHHMPFVKPFLEQYYAGGGCGANSPQVHTWSGMATGLFYCLSHLGGVPAFLMRPYEPRCHCCGNRDHLQQTVFIGCTSCRSGRKMANPTTNQLEFLNLVNGMSDDFPPGTLKAIFLSGIAGTGKTTLMKYLATHCQHSSMTVWLAVKHMLLDIARSDLSNTDCIYNKIKVEKRPETCSPIRFFTVAKLMMLMLSSQKHYDDLGRQDFSEFQISELRDTCIQQLQAGSKQYCSKMLWSPIYNSAKMTRNPPTIHIWLVDEISLIRPVEFLFLLFAMQMNCEKSGARILLVVAGDQMQLEPISPNGLQNIPKDEMEYRIEALLEGDPAALISNNAYANACWVLKNENVHRHALLQVTRSDARDLIMHKFLQNYSICSWGDGVYKSYIINQMLRDIGLSCTNNESSAIIECGDMCRRYLEFAKTVFATNDKARVAKMYYKNNPKLQATGNFLFPDGRKYFYGPMYDQWEIPADIRQFDPGFVIMVKKNVTCMTLWTNFYNTLVSFMKNHLPVTEEDHPNELSQLGLFRFMRSYYLGSVNNPLSGPCLDHLIVGFVYKIHAVEKNNRNPHLVVGKEVLLEQIHYFDANNLPTNKMEAESHLTLGYPGFIRSLLLLDVLTNKRFIMFPYEYEDRRLGVRVYGFPIHPKFIWNTFQIQGLTVCKDVYIDACSFFTGGADMYVCLSRVTNSNLLKGVINYN